jgi:hypothetical protein
MDMSHKDDLISYIQQSVESVCPYNSEQERRLYHAGFLAAFIASLIQDDNITFHKFKKKIERVQKRNKPL